MKQRLLTAAAIGAVIVIVAVTYSVRSSGQQPAGPIQRSIVNVVRVKPEMVDAWIDFQATKTIPALKKAGVRQRDAYQSAYGTGFEYRFVTPLATFADRDNPASPIEQALGAAGAREYNEAYRKLIVGTQNSVIQGIPDTSLDPNPDSIYKVLVLSLVHVTPGRGNDYVSYIKNDLLPVQKQGQVKRYLVNQVIFGGDPNEYRTATFMEKFADLDAGPAAVRVLGQDGAAKLTQKTAGIVASIQRSVYLRNEALSFRAKPTT
jgi:hypothetical protein